MSAGAVPEVAWAFIGGSGTYGSDFPDAAGAGARVIRKDLIFETPHGASPPFSIFETAAGRRCLTVRLHGWRRGVTRGEASQQVFWVLHQAGVKNIFSEAGVGSINPLLDPRDIVIPDDFVDLTTDRNQGLIAGGNLLIMRDPVCQRLAGSLADAAANHARGRVFGRGTCVVTEGPRFESRAEIRMMQTYGDIIGQSMCPEVWLSRDIGACYAALYLVVNFAEGVVRDWEHRLLKEIFEDDAAIQSRIILEAIDAAEDGDCGCQDLRKPSLL
ncbi:MAG: MTAP family purine nucleoside phosphorylase [Actinobacteria bacterium]|nr:MTAP family purine nucleoside phosphorylase [Actinomycetota bacterium]MCL5882452.1 MTAP family purine nucleoside phosphorylase [Actinomycetota bacterium]